MIVEFTNSVTGAPIHINPEYVEVLSPNPDDPTGSTVVKLKDGVTVQVRGDHEEVAERLADA